MILLAILKGIRIFADFLGTISGIKKNIKENSADIKVLEHDCRSDFHYVTLQNVGAAPARRFEMTTKSEYGIRFCDDYYREEPILPGQTFQISYFSRARSHGLPVTIRWSDDMGRHSRKRVLS